MASKKKTPSTSNNALVPKPYTGEVAPTKCSPPLNVRYTVSNPHSKDPTIILVAVPIKNPIPDTTNTPVDPTEALKTIVSNTTVALPFLIAPISYEPETVILQMENLNQDLIDAAATYKASVPNPKNPFCLRLTFHSISSPSTFRTTINTAPRPLISTQISKLRLSLNLTI